MGLGSRACIPELGIVLRCWLRSLSNFVQKDEMLQCRIWMYMCCNIEGH